ncbi:MAG: phosphoesterase [Gemmatales bacterium]|nr:MAG: phosphoesterase [Gemmatales bacterium]
MADKSQERILVVPRAVFEQLGVFQGLCLDADRYLERLLQPENLSYMRRAEAEENPDFKQLVPYVVLKWRDQVFHYTRGKATTESRLQALRSVGVGGHVNEEDADLFDHPYQQAMLREVAEEVHLETTYVDRRLGLINDDATPVGQVHLGIVHVFELAEPNVRRREQALTRSGFAPIAELKNERDQFETWSRFVLDIL